MKKLFAVLLALTMVVSLCACGAAEVAAPVEDVTEVVVEEAVESVVETPVEETPAEEAPAETGIRPEFKQAMDDYENFYNEYCEFMKKYMENPTDLSLLAEYSDIMQKSLEMSDSFAKWESEDMSSEELSYYLEVSSRVSQKLLEVAS